MSTAKMLTTCTLLPTAELSGRCALQPFPSEGMESDVRSGDVVIPNPKDSPSPLGTDCFYPNVTRLPCPLPSSPLSSGRTRKERIQSPLPAGEGGPIAATPRLLGGRSSGGDAAAKLALSRRQPRRRRGRRKRIPPPRWQAMACAEAVARRRSSGRILLSLESGSQCRVGSSSRVSCGGPIHSGGSRVAVAAAAANGGGRRGAGGGRGMYCGSGGGRNHCRTWRRRNRQ